MISNINRLLLKSPQIAVKNLDVYLSYVQIVYAYADKDDNEFYNHYAFELTQALIKLLNVNKTQHPVHLLYITQFLNLSISSGFVNANLENIFTKVDSFIKDEFQKETMDRSLLVQGLFYIVSRFQNTTYSTQHRNDLIGCYEVGLDKLEKASGDVVTGRFTLENFLPKINVANSSKYFNSFLSSEENKTRLKAALLGKLEKDSENELKKLLLITYDEVTNHAELYIPQLVFYLNLIR
ncbi:hypothetical protein [Niabella hibiscisoli]|uniref:hypothetical protein n=1 Tax=Niabella hibiscisoli TaxID=1825928 RepID=UPI001F0DFA5A|nr:hypothetical protein [Niabella hibiscisoli]MCH5720653.1 hypothetical protein [Niabella hibiscisoli]